MNTYIIYGKSNLDVLKSMQILKEEVMTKVSFSEGSR